VKSRLVTSKLNDWDWPVNAWLPVRKAATVGFVAFLLLSVAASRVQAQNYSIVYSFQGGPNDGCGPEGELVPDKQGNLYGTTGGGGIYGYGTIFELSASAQENVLYSFRGYPTDGAVPTGNLVRDAAGNLMALPTRAAPTATSTRMD